MNSDTILKISPDPSLPAHGRKKTPKRGKKGSSLWQREVGRDFIKMFPNC